MGQPLPDRIANAPELYEGLGLYLQAFNDLDSERSHAMGVSRIPWSKIHHYAKANEFSEEQKDDLLYLIQAMDRNHCEKLNEKSKQTNG
ncbi:MAG: hypothetical protein V4493_01315 [Pseudomonadota bacterium]